MTSERLNGAGGSPVTVLLVEDEPVVRQFCVEVLEEAGFAVIEAGCAAEALQVLETRKDLHILYSDINMPGSSGVDLARCVHDRWPHMQVLLTSGRERPGPMDLSDGDSFLPKPCTSEAILAVIRTLAARFDLSEAPHSGC